MNKSYFLSFFILFIFMFSLGCDALRKDGGSLEASENSLVKGNLNFTVSVNGKPATTFDLMSKQTAVIGLKFKNIDDKSMSNIDGRVYGFEVSGNGADKIDSLDPKENGYLEWVIKAPTMGESERITIPLVIRVCYEQTTRGTADLIVIPESKSTMDYGTAFTEPKSVVGIDFDVKPIKIIGSDSSSTAVISIKNRGDGWVDYFNYSLSEQALYKLKEVNFDLLAKRGGMRIVSLNDYGLISGRKPLNFTFVNTQPSNNNYQQRSVLRIASGDTYYNFSDVGEVLSYGYFLKMVGGKEASFRLGLNAPTPGIYDDIFAETLKVNATYSYCVDIATLNANLRGR